MDLKTLQKEAHAIAKDHGWWDEERTFGDLIAEVHSKLSKALEAYRSGNIDGHVFGVASELAYVVIRVADMAEWYGVNMAEESTDFTDDLWLISLVDNIQSFGDWIVACHLLTVDAIWGKWGPRTPDYAPREWPSCLALLIALVQRMAAHYGIDLDAAIAAKMEYNRGRSYRHGGKVL